MEIYKDNVLVVADRRLIYIPIIHTAADMGRLSIPARRAALQKLGLRGLKNKENVIDQYWTSIEQTVAGLDLPFEKVRLYQDGLPVCGQEPEIVSELAAESRHDTRPATSRNLSRNGRSRSPIGKRQNGSVPIMPNS